MRELTAVTVTYNSAAVIGKLLESLAPAELPVVVVDNGSRDNTMEVAAVYPNVRVVKNQNTGYGRGANRGFAEAATPYVMLVNPDVVISKEAINAMLACANSDPTIGIVGARMFQKDAKGNKHYTTVAAFNGEGLATTNWIVGALMLIRRDALEKLGAFDENIFLFFEETDLCKRFVKAGYKLVVTKAAEAEHAEGSSSAPSLKVLKIKSWHSAWSKAYYYRKHFPAATYYRKSLSKIFGSLMRVGKAALRRDSQNITKNSYELMGVLAALVGVKAFKGEVGRLT